jgi:anti-sigma factor RsiW
MREQHLSDEAIAAFADDVLPKHARERARRHTATCAECNYAVAVQREAVWALRAAPAPSLPGGLLDRLREVPETTPIQRVPSTVDEHGNAMFSTVAAAAFVAQPAPAKSRSLMRPVALTAASIAAAGAIAAVAVVAESSHHATPSHIAPASVRLPATH